MDTSGVALGAEPMRLVSFILPNLLLDSRMCRSGDGIIITSLASAARLRAARIDPHSAVVVEADPPIVQY